MMRVLFAFVEVSGISLQRDLPSVSDQIIREIRMRVHLMIIAVKGIKTMEFRHSSCPSISQPPFAEELDPQRSSLLLYALCADRS